MRVAGSFLITLLMVCNVPVASAARPYAEFVSSYPIYANARTVAATSASTTVPATALTPTQAKTSTPKSTVSVPVYANSDPEMKICIIQKADCLKRCVEPTCVKQCEAQAQVCIHSDSPVTPSSQAGSPHEDETYSKPQPRPAHPLTTSNQLSAQLPTPAMALDESQIPFIERTWDSAPNFSETKVLNIINDKNLPKQIPLTLVIFKDSGWTLDEVMAKLRRTAEIYGVQCGVNFNPVMILETRSSGGPTFNSKNADKHLIYEFMEEAGAVVRPLMYFAKNEITDFGKGGIAWPQGYGRDKRPPAIARDSAILLRNYATLRDYSVGLEEPFAQGHFEVMAHELAHILLDTSHQPVAGHIMSEDPQRTNKVLPEQCKTIEQNFL